MERFSCKICLSSTKNLELHRSDQLQPNFLKLKKKLPWIFPAFFLTYSNFVLVSIFHSTGHLPVHVLLVFLNPGSQIQVSVLLTLKQSAFTPHVRFLSQLGNPKKLRKIYRDYCVKTSLLIVIDYFNKYIIYNVHCSSKNNVLVGRRNIYIYCQSISHSSN